MKPGTWKRLIRNTAIEVAFLLALYGLLWWRASSTDVVAKLFAAHGQLPAGDVSLAVAFVAVRFLVVVALPGFVAYRLVRIGIGAAVAWRRPGTR